ncbi:unnamed protein product [Calicophoron daubneyi]|uniref:Uncharacterized protein n=1 Tax=Calicophoron daubneyi TaxID=300641 RepID=A0AAV2T3M6_CALDB
MTLTLDELFLKSVVLSNSSQHWRQCNENLQRAQNSLEICLESFSSAGNYSDVTSRDCRHKSLKGPPGGPIINLISKTIPCQKAVERVLQRYTATQGTGRSDSEIQCNALCQMFAFSDIVRSLKSTIFNRCMELEAATSEPLSTCIISTVSDASGVELKRLVHVREFLGLRRKNAAIRAMRSSVDALQKMELWTSATDDALRQESLQARINYMRSRMTELQAKLKEKKEESSGIRRTVNSLKKFSQVVSERKQKMDQLFSENRELSHKIPELLEHARKLKADLIENIWSTFCCTRDMLSNDLMAKVICAFQSDRSIRWKLAVQKTSTQSLLHRAVCGTPVYTECCQRMEIMARNADPERLLREIMLFIFECWVTNKRAKLVHDIPMILEEDWCTNSKLRSKFAQMAHRSWTYDLRD